MVFLILLMLIKMEYYTLIIWINYNLIFINPPFEGKYDIMIINIKSKFKLASDLFIMHSKTSVLGDIFEKEEEKIFKRHNTLTQDELTAILEMYKMISFNLLCAVFGINMITPNFK